MESEAKGNKSNLTIEGDFEFISKPTMTQEDEIIVTADAQDVIQKESEALTKRHCRYSGCVKQNSFGVGKRQNRAANGFYRKKRPQM